MSVLLIAAVLGLLAFFEPCTIATHSLFAARARRHDLFTLWLVRSALLVGLCVVAVLLPLPTAELSGPQMALGLTLIAAIYLISRLQMKPCFGLITANGYKE